MEEKFLSVIIPAFNEEKRILPTLEDVYDYLKNKDFSWEVLIVDDGSIDRTKEVVRKFCENHPNFILIENKENKGKGGVVKQGMLKARGEWRLFMDADNSTPISEIDNFYEYMKDYDIIIGSRYLKEGLIKKKQPLIRRIISRGGNLLAQLLILPGIKDTQCGFKLFSKKAAEIIFPKQRFYRWSFDIEILAIAKKYGFKIKEVGVEWRDSPFSKLKAARAALRTLKDLLIIKFNLIRGKY